MKTASEICIYCSCAFDPTKGEGDHVIPAALGEFDGDVRFRRVCPPCNNKIGRSEQQLLSAGPPAFFRQIVKPASGRPKRHSGAMKAAMGSRAPESTVKEAGYSELVERLQDDPRNVQALDQLVVLDEAGNEHFIRLFPRMRADQLTKRVANAGCKTLAGSRLSSDDGNWNEYVQLIKTAFPTMNVRSSGTTKPGDRPVIGRIKLTVNDHYFRALAKIAFHYYLSHNKRGLRGDEDDFSPIRQFIIDGGDIDSFFRQSAGTFALPFGRLPSGDVMTSRDWCHVIAAHETAVEIVVYIQMFIGPGVLPRPEYIVLAHHNSDSSSSAWGHVFLYDRIQPAVGKAGRVEPLNVHRLR